MFSSVFRYLAIALFSLGVAFRAGHAEVAPPGKYFSGAPGAFLVAPTGEYRTRLGWLMASLITYDNLGLLERFNIFGAVIPGKYEAAINAEMNHYRSLGGMAYYRYSESLVRDLARLQILTLENDRLSLALDTFAEGLVADIAAMSLNAGIKHILPARRQGFLALDSEYMTPGTEKNLIARHAFVDLELRYGELMEKSYMETIKRQIGAGIDAGDLQDLMSESVISAAVGQAIGQVKQAPERLMDVLRRQKVMDVAAYGCACVLDASTHQPPDALAVALGQTREYRTRLGYFLSLQLTPPATSIINAMSGTTAKEFLDRELRAVGKMRGEEPVRYASYMRSLLVDLEQLEDAQIKALQSGTTLAFIESTVMNVLFGALAVGGGGTAQVLSMLGNAGYGAISSYETMSDELKIRAQMAALRETVLDQILPLADKCGCGVGVAVAPKTVKQGKSSGDD